MDTQSFKSLLPGKYLRTMRQNNINISSVDDQRKFDNLFHLVFQHERTLVVRAADAIEKKTASRPAFLRPHKNQLLQALSTAHQKELKWQIALDKSESKIARVKAFQGLFNLCTANPLLKDDFEKIVFALGHKMIPSIQGEIRKLKNTKMKL